MVREVRAQEPGLSVNAACKRIGPQLGSCRTRLRRENAELRRANQPEKLRSRENPASTEAGTLHPFFSAQGANNAHT